MKPTRRGTAASTRAAAALLLLLAGSAVGVRFGWQYAVSAAVVVGLAAAAVSAVRGSRSDDGGDSGTVWDAIPSWQYSGRHAESGGLTRDEQESALRDVQEEADRRERRR
ncbi:hypothetical protein [Halorarum halobium]|uniref:hypothetical protein n=1 Tax=Halorarum halobium TaxID=3075121 RepID=UPI0028A6C2AE|nr:hypothetical protein [Halobaculum sp. XH14]